ncbi:hypothetical protein HJG60_008441 [Phyllostomus discolor]|uniref:Uncharacterized protein n=1 Tax=Phyllostomus discolor TaxID=89673 RepID=A0A834DN42_9CHIR|nr:hypothetical protein HJG60_008441 [Phyllostomus discolor]
MQRKKTPSPPVAGVSDSDFSPRLLMGSFEDQRGSSPSKELLLVAAAKRKRRAVKGPKPEVAPQPGPTLPVDGLAYRDPDVCPQWALLALARGALHSPHLHMIARHGLQFQVPVRPASRMEGGGGEDAQIPD